MCNKQTNKMEVTNKLYVKLKSPVGVSFEVIFDTNKFQSLDELLEKYNYNDHEVIDWKLKRVLFIP
jgi:hypothetical protein